MNFKFTILLVALITLLSNSTKAYFTHQIQDPRNTWKSSLGTIEEATISVKPQGIYTEIGVYMSFSAKDYYRQHVQDTFEVQFYFDLPEGAIVTDSWLWIGSDIVKARIMERSRATNIYENIVNRRKDPSILYKNSPTQYELRVFPMAGNEMRKVKLTYLIPSDLLASGSFTQLPLNIVNNSVTPPQLSFVIYPDSSRGFTTPTLSSNLLPLTYNTQTNTYTASTNQTVSSLSVEYNSVIQNNAFFSTQKTTDSSGYFQLAFQPSVVLGNTQPQKVLLLIDYASNNTTYTKSYLLDQVKSLIKKYLIATDSFNVIWGGFNNLMFSNTWLPAAEVDNIFNNINVQGLANHSYLQNLLSGGISYTNQHGKATIMLLSSYNETNTSPSQTSQALGLATDAINSMNPKCPIHVVNFCNKDYTLKYINNRYYYGNELYLSYLATNSGGEYDQVASFYSSYYSYVTFEDFNTVSNRALAKIAGSIRELNVQLTTTNGFGFSTQIQTESQGINTPFNSSVRALGRFIGDFPITINVSGIKNGNFVYSTLTIPSQENIDSITKFLWLGNYIARLEGVSNNNTSIQREIIDSSIRHRILSTQTAFLALEPTDSTQICDNCEDESEIPAAIHEFADSLNIKAYPNPFNNEISFELADNAIPESITIMDITGRIVQILSNTDGSKIIKWNGTNSGGQNVAGGLYFALIETSLRQKAVIKIQKL